MNFALERDKGHRTQSCDVLASLVPMVTGDLFHYFHEYKQHFLIVIWKCSLFAIRGLLIELVFDTVAPKSAETSPFTPVGAGHSIIGISHQPALLQLACVSPGLVTPFHILVVCECVEILAGP